MNRTVLAVDIGTSSLKAALIDETGAVLASSRCRFPDSRRTGADWALALSDAVTILSPGPNLAAVAISGNGPTLASINSDNSSGPVLLWNEPLANPVHSQSLFIPRLVEYRSRYPNEWNEARFVLSGPEWLLWALTGEAVTILPEERYERAYWTPEELRQAAIPADKLAPYAPAGAVIGYTGKGLTAATIALPAGIPVVSGGPDFFVALIGTGTIEAGTGCDRAGTSEGLNLCTASPAPGPTLRVLPGVLPGAWNSSCLLPDTGAIFHEWRKASGQAGRPYPEIMREIIASDIHPLQGVEPHPGRVVVEEIGFAVREAAETLAAATGFRPAWRLSGGQARNELWNAMKADITGETFELTSTPDGELMGDAALGFTAIGSYSNLAEAAKEMVSIKKRYEPNPLKAAEYTEKYRAWKDRL